MKTMLRFGCIGSAAKRGGDLNHGNGTAAIVVSAIVNAVAGARGQHAEMIVMRGEKYELIPKHRVGAAKYRAHIVSHGIFRPGRREVQ